MSPKRKNSDLHYTVNSDFLGQIEVHTINWDDLKFFEDTLKKDLDSRNFTVEILYQIMDSSELSEKDLIELEDDELKSITKQIVNNENDIFQYLDIPFDFEDFEESIKEYISSKIKPFQKHMIENYSYSSRILNDALKTKKLVSDFTKSNRVINEISRSVLRNQLTISETMKSAIETRTQIENLIQPILNNYESLAPQINLISNLMSPTILKWQEWIKENEKIIETFTEISEKLYEKYKIKEEKALSVLKEYNWFLTPSTPLEFIDEIMTVYYEGDLTEDKIDELFIDYFTTENCKNLREMVEKWDVDIVNERENIILDCLILLEKKDDLDINISNVIIPTLISQIDGIQKEYMIKNGLTYQWNKNGWFGDDNEYIDWKEWYEKQLPEDSLYDLANDVFLNLLFQKAIPFEELEVPFGLNRHKILHGENINYGEIDHVIRSFMILDFLSGLSEISNTKEN